MPEEPKKGHPCETFPILFTAMIAVLVALGGSAHRRQRLEFDLDLGGGWSFGRVFGKALRVRPMPTAYTASSSTRCWRTAPKRSVHTSSTHVARRPSTHPPTSGAISVNLTATR